MSTEYVLTCSCGQTFSVAPRQAGDRVPCGCGIELEVPPLSQLRLLPPAEPTASDQRGTTSWGFRQGLAAAAGMVCLLLVTAGGYFWVTEPRPPSVARLEAYYDQISTANQQQIESWTPQQAWAFWWQSLRPMTLKPAVLEHQRLADGIEQQAVFHRYVRWSAFGLAALAAVAAGAAYAAIR